MPQIVKIVKKRTMISPCDLQDPIKVYKRTIDATPTDNLKIKIDLAFLYDCWSLFDDRGTSVPYWDRVNNQQMGITCYFYLRTPDGETLDKTNVIEYNNRRYSVVASVQLGGARGRFIRCDCSELGKITAEGSVV